MQRLVNLAGINARKKLQKSVQMLRTCTETLLTLPLFPKQETFNDYIRMKLGIWKSYSEFLREKMR